MVKLKIKCSLCKKDIISFLPILKNYDIYHICRECAKRPFSEIYWELGE